MPESHWLRRPVLLLLSGLLVAMYLLAWGQRTLELWRGGWVDERGMPFGGDYITFWAGSRMALDGRALEVFQPEAFFAAQEAALDGNAAHFLWNYPPTFHLFVLPLSLVDFVTSTWLWWLVGVPVYLVAIYAVVPRWETLVVALSGSAVLLNLAHGQNGFLLAAVVAVGLACVVWERPVLGGVVLGCLSIKPHFGVLLPVAFAAAGQWRAFGATAVSLGLWMAVSTGVFGFAYWEVFVDNLSVVRRAIDSGELPPHKLVTPYVAGLSIAPGLAVPLQAVASLGAVVATALAFRRGVGWASMAVVVLATCLVSPYLFDYDLILLGPAAAFVYRDRVRSGWLAGEREVWLVAAMFPLLTSAAYGAVEIQIGPVLPSVLLGYALVGALRGSATAVG